jgi:RNA polymerase sigma-32 factor
MTKHTNTIENSPIKNDNYIYPLKNEDGQEYEDNSPANISSLVVARKPRKKEDRAADTLTAYLQEIRQYPRLSPEEEKALAIRYFEYKDLDAAYKLVSSNLWLVVKIAREYERAAKNILDLIQEGNIGLMEAIKNFDPFKEVRFPSYAVWWIKAYIIKYVIANWRLVKIGTTQAQRKLFFNLHNEKERLEREGIFPSPKLLADNLSVREKDIIEMEQRLSGGDLSIDTPENSDEERSLLSILPAPNNSAEDIMFNMQRQTLLRSALDEFVTTLSPRDQTIFNKRMLAEDKETLQELSETLKLSRERVRQIESRIQEKLKAFLSTKFGEDLQDIMTL